MSLVNVQLALLAAERLAKLAERYRQTAASSVAEGRDMSIEDLRSLQQADDLARAELQAEIDRQMPAATRAA
ncbi:MAG: hypothetical protein ACRCZI_11200 [Cetobacterium sp.]